MPDSVPRRPLDDWTAEGFSAALGEYLIGEGRLDKRSLDRAHRLVEESGSRLDEVLTQLGLVSERALAEAMAALLGLCVAAVADYPAAPVLAERLQPKFLRKARAVPIALDGRVLTVAMIDPLDRFVARAIEVAAGVSVTVRVAVPIDLDAAMDRLYAAREREAQSDVEQLSAIGDNPLEEDAQRLKDLASEEPLIRLVNQLIARAVETKASDIHIEPLEDRLRIRYRFDGALHEVEGPPQRLQAAVVSRIKIMAQLDIAERRLPQDGRIKLVVRGHEIDIRVATVPSLHGEKVVLRILDRSTVELNFDRLGFTGTLRQRFCDMLELPNGIVIVTGPTGSGKTTTLYTGLIHLNAIERNIITAEDPVEYQLPGITQIQVRPQIGLTFATLLRAMLRHDPDIIMVGEIRDLETAQIAVQAALTGHLVLSTLHTNGSVATLARLKDMGLEDYLLTATLNGVVAQRLVRRLCSSCKRPTEPADEVRERFGLDRFFGGGPIVLYEPVGCEHCRNTGYAGRLAVAELLAIDEPIRRLVLRRADAADVFEAARAAGMETMFECAMAHCAAGTTSLGEVLRSVRLDG